MKRKSKRLMTKIAIVVGHARQGTFCEAVGEAYRKGAAEAGHEARHFVTARMTLDPSLREGYARVQALEPDLAAASKALLAADHIVLIFPLWLGTLPAIFKGFLERVLQPQLVEPARQGKFVKVLEVKSARIIRTMGMPGLVCRWWYGAYALEMLKRNILRFMGVSPIRSTLYGMIEGVSAEQRRLWLEEAAEMGRRAD
jgi:putative NADPH-quinone reductase